MLKDDCIFLTKMFQSFVMLCCMCAGRDSNDAIVTVFSSYIFHWRKFPTILFDEMKWQDDKCPLTNLMTAACNNYLTCFSKIYLIVNKIFKINAQICISNIFFFLTGDIISQCVELTFEECYFIDFFLLVSKPTRGKNLENLLSIF